MSEQFIFNTNFDGLFCEQDVQDICKLLSKHIKVVHLNRYGEKVLGIQKFDFDSINEDYIKGVKSLWLARKLRRDLSNKDMNKKLSKV